MPSLTSTISSGMTTAVSQLAENGTITASTVTTGSIVIGVVVEIVIMLLIIGNLLMVITLLLYKPWTIPDLLLFSLSLADVINGMVPVHILNIMNSFYGQNRWTSGLCALFTWMTFSLRMTSVCTITIISAERMILLTKPLRHHSIVTIKKARIAVIAVWLLSGFLATFPFMGIGRSGFRAGYCFYQLYDLGTAFGVTIETIGIIQLIVVLACFISIKLSSGEFIKRQSVMAATHQTGSSLNLKERETAGTKQVRQLSKMMAIVVLLYYISWLPYLLTNLVSLVYGHLPHAVDILVGFLSLVSAIINPLLYGKMSLRYRRGYQFIFKKIRSLCGGEKPNGNFFDDRRRGSYSTAYSNTIKRGSMGSTAGLEVNQNVNKAYEDDERNHHNSYNNNEDIDEHNPDVQGNEYDNEDIAIYPVEINNKVNHNDNDDNNYGDEDDHDDTQITICPLNESVKFAGNEEGLFNQGASVEDDEREGAGPSTVEEEDFSICPYDESIIAHFEDLRKLADQDENDIIDTKGEITDNENKENEELRQTNEPSDTREDGKNISQSKEIGSPNVANKRSDVDDNNIPGTVMDIDEIHHVKKGCDDDDDKDNDEDVDGSDDNDDLTSSAILDHNIYHDHQKEKDDSRIEDDDGDESHVDDEDDVVNGDINPPPMLQQSKTALMPTTTDHQEALLNQGFESDSQSDGGSQDYSDSSGSYGEGSILGNYDITQPEPDTDDEDEDQICGNNGNDVESEKELNGEEKCTQKEEKKKDEGKGRKEGRKGGEETENTRDYVKESNADDENNLTDEENEDEDEEENGENDSSSKASGETSYDIMGDLLEEETPTIEQQKPHGHFFVDDIVKRMVEDEKQRSSMESYNLLTDGNKHVDEQDKLDKLFENDMSAYGNSTTVKTDIDKKPLAGDCVISKDVATTTTTTVSRIAEEKNRNKSEIQQQSEGSDHDDFGHGGGGGDESDNAHDDDDSHGDDDEGDDSSDDGDDSGGDNGDGNGDFDNDDDGNDDDDSSNDDVDDDGGEGGGVDDNGDNDGKCGRDGGDDHGVCNKKNGDNNEDVLDSSTHDFQEENEPNFIVDNSIFKKAKPEFSGRKKYTRSTSDLLRKELGEI